MRGIQTIIHRVQVDLPITEEEWEFAFKHFDKVVARRIKTRNILTGVAGVAVFIGVILLLFGG
jgi:hypothetical protein